MVNIFKKHFRKLKYELYLFNFQDEQKKLQLLALQEALKDTNDDERRRILAQFEDDLHNVTAKLKV